MQRTVDIPTESQPSTGSLHVPDGTGPWPAVIMYPDAGGVREALLAMGDRMAALGYVTLVPNFYYAYGDYKPFDMPNVFADADERARLMEMVHSVTAETAVRDARTYVDFLASLPETTGSAVGTTGYCMGGRLSLIVAGHLGDRVAAAASFHGGNIASAEDPDSPHLRASEIEATVYVAGAIEDASFPDEQRDRLESALTAAGVQHTIETYPAHHGFAVPDNPTFDEAAAERHWQALSQLFAASLGGA